MVNQYEIAHIHVGKCGGSSINKALHMHGVRFTEFHCGSANKEIRSCLEKDNGALLYLISLRDPLNRFISAFNFDKYEKTILSQPKNDLWARIYDSFSSANDLVEHLWSDQQSLRMLAWKAVRSSHLHIHLGLSWYISPATAERLPQDRTHVIRTEHIESDFKNFLNKLDIEYSINAMPMDKPSQDFLSKIGIEQPKFLSPRAIEILRGLLFEDYSVLRILHSRGILDQPYD